MSMDNPKKASRFFSWKHAVEQACAFFLEACRHENVIDY
jgi:hypothetical protein